MNSSTIQSNWNVAKGKLKWMYAQLTDDDLCYVAGREDELLDRIQRRSNRPREEIETFLLEECGCDFSPDRPPAPARPDYKPHRAFGRHYGSGRPDLPGPRRVSAHSPHQR